ncbi:MAG: cold shock domain-containing protein [Candidatus Heimdallarchaeota archaeon]|nr:cold shock domain-containing protein [Candidatus Heimdallarchaeota archaeon]
MQGKIKKILHNRGFGFISIDGESEEIFFHQSQLTGDLTLDDLEEEQAVKFDIEETSKGPQATNISKA